MRKSLRSGLFILALALGGIAANARAADTYKVDPVHSFVIFKIRHMDTSNVYGRFNAPEGTLVIDSDPSKSTIKLSVKVDNIDTNNAQRDTHLKSTDFFAAKQFPDITFSSTSIKSIDDKTWEVTGDLTIKGTTKPITVKFEKVGQAQGQGGQPRVGYETTFTLKRSDYKVDGLPQGVGDEVTLTVALEAGKA